MGRTDTAQLGVMDCRESKTARPLPVLLACALALAAGGAAAATPPGDHAFSITHQGHARSYLVHVPAQARGQPLPVVINYHGGGGNAKVHQAYSRMDGAADRDGYIAVYPNGTSGIGERFLTWNAGACCGAAAARQVDDVGFTLAMLDDLARRVPVDAQRIYATGLSNGAMMAYRLAAEAPHRIAAVAGVAGAMTLAGFAPARAVPVMHIHSMDDQRALYGGGLGPAFPYTDTRVFHQSVEAMLGKWINHNGCPAEPEVAAPLAGAPGAPDEKHTAVRYTHAPCRDGTQVVLWKLTGAGHVWPGGVMDYLKWLLGPGTAVIDANAEIWRFVSRFRRVPANPPVSPAGARP
jgi:polyhydroxybutyrate depolymerase